LNRCNRLSTTSLIGWTAARQYFIGRDLADAFAAHSQGGGPMKTHFGINVDDDYTCLDRPLEVFVAGS
jgi:hypothetical protein